MVGWLVFNGTYSTIRLYHAMSSQEINPITYLLTRLLEEHKYANQEHTNKSKMYVTNHIALFMNQHSHIPEYLIDIHYVRLHTSVTQQTLANICVHDFMLSTFQSKTVLFALGNRIINVSHLEAVDKCLQISDKNKRL